MLSDRQIRQMLASGDLQVKPREGIDARIQPASLDIRLGHQFMVMDRQAAPIVDPKQDQSAAWKLTEVAEGGQFFIQPDELVLATTIEHITLSDALVARVEGKSSLGRLGILVHATAGFVDPGWSGHITLEISTVSGVPTALYPGMPIGQISLEELGEPALVGYTGKYAGQTGPTVSAFHRNWSGSRWM